MQFSDDPGLAETLYDIAREYRWVKKYDVAKNMYQQIIEQYPQSAFSDRARLGIARIDILTLISSQRYSDASAAIDKLVKDFSRYGDLPETLYWTGVKYEEYGRYDSAKNLYALVVQQYPDCGYADKARFLAAKMNIFLLIESGKDTEAANVLDWLIADFNGHPDLAHTIFEVGEKYFVDATAVDYREKAIVALEKAMGKLQSDSLPQWALELYVCAADCYVEVKDYRSTIRCYKKVVMHWPDYEYAWHMQFMIGRYYQDMSERGDIGKSEADSETKGAYERLLEKYPECKAAEAAQNWLKAHQK